MIDLGCKARQELSHQGLLVSVLSCIILQTTEHHMARALELPGGVPPHYRFLGLLSEIPWNRAQKSFKKHRR